MLDVELVKNLIDILVLEGVTIIGDNGKWHVI